MSYEDNLRDDISEAFTLVESYPDTLESLEGEDDFRDDLSEPSTLEELNSPNLGLQEAERVSTQSNHARTQLEEHLRIHTEHVLRHQPHLAEHMRIHNELVLRHNNHIQPHIEEHLRIHNQLVLRHNKAVGMNEERSQQHHEPSQPWQEQPKREEQRHKSRERESEPRRPRHWWERLTRVSAGRRGACL